jgi:hypothetical protein
LVVEFGYLLDRRLASEWFDHGFMGAWRGRLVNLLVARVVGHLVDLLFAGTVAVQVLDPMVAAAGASPRHIEFTEAFVETVAAPWSDSSGPGPGLRLAMAAIMEEDVTAACGPWTAQGS